MRAHTERDEDRGGIMKILWITNPTTGPYGYSVVAKHVSQGLKKAGHEVWVLSTLLMGNIVRDENGIPNLPPYFDMYGKTSLPQYLKGLDIDVVITLLDTWDPQSYDIPDIVHKFKIPLVSHVTTRSYPLSPHWSTFLERADHIITPTWWGKQTVEEIFPNKVSYIQHGVDLEIFKPDESSRDEVRKRLGYEDKFVFLAVGRNKEMQKRYDILLKAFKAFLVNVPDAQGKAVLHIHANQHESYNLEEMRNMGYYDIGMEHIVFSSVRWNGEKLELCDKSDPKSMITNPNWGLDDTEMAKLYNMADCFVHSGEGESFCLPCLEAQACGIPCVVPDHSSFQELVGKPKSGILVDIITEETTPTLTDVKLPDIIDLAKKMALMWDNAELRKECSNNAMKNAKNYTWERVVEKWKFILEKITEPRALNYKTGELGF
jgi:glycosyltransferase involved in cell wall biosynthesis